MTIRKKPTNLNKRARSIGKLYRLFEDDIWGHFLFKNINFFYRYKFLLRSSNLSYRNMREIWEIIKLRKLAWYRRLKFAKFRKTFFKLDIIRRFKKRRKRTKVSVAALDAKKLLAFYNIPLKQLRSLIYNCFDVSFSAKYRSFLLSLESRLDVVIYRLHFVKTVGEARQLINHGKITVNGKIINKQSYILKSNDVVSSIFSMRNLILSNILRKILPLNRNEFYYYYPLYYEVNYRILSAKLVIPSKPFKETWIPFFSKTGPQFVRNGYTFFRYRKRFF